MNKSKNIKLYFSVFLVIASLLTSSFIKNDEAGTEIKKEISQKEKSSGKQETVSQSNAYEAVLPLISPDFVKTIFLVPTRIIFAFYTEIFTEYKAIYLSKYFITLFSYIIVTNAP